ncbi:hypothetical protein CEXT_483781 [Caerostris extrusa]|uniref:Uncharacterized protein n=1 Tax=Caerostris extrusa TaxID=172846 RepID=A0AAV4XB43_CAEEX|nr:hypothetical protein CEXT_483781 [Caerostris extrusa]
MEQKIIVVVNPSELLIHVNRKENGEVQLEGCEGKFVQIVLEALRIQYEIVVSKDIDLLRHIAGCYSGTLLSRIIQPTKVPPIRTFHELSRAVQSGDHQLYATETQIPCLLDSEKMI